MGKKDTAVRRVLDMNVLRMGRFFYCTIILIVILFLIVIWPYISPNTQWSTTRTTFNYRAYSDPQLIDLPEIRKLCANTDWRNDMYLDCYFLNMGTFNAINRLHVCIRWAIDAGMGLILPEFSPRDPKNLSNLWETNIPKVSINYLLDDEFLYKALAHNCPRMKIVERTALGQVDELEGLWGSPLYPVQAKMGPGDFRNYLDRHIDANLTRSGKGNLPLIVREKDPMGAWYIMSDPVEFQIDYHRLVTHFNKPLIRAAQGILNKLPYLFYGLHYRTERDWKKVNGAPSDDEMIQYPLRLSHVPPNPTYYTACGDVAKLNDFKNRARKYGVVVVDKWDLIDESDRPLLEALTFDQLGIIDFLVLLHADVFWGYGGSMLSQSVGLWRHIYQFNNFYYRGEDYQQPLIGPKWTHTILHDILW